MRAIFGRRNVYRGANTTFIFLLLFFSCLSLELEVCTTSPLSLVYPKEHSPHQTEMIHFLNTVLMQNAEWPLEVGSVHMRSSAEGYAC